jgi:glucose-6-phosphate-specific signal transduction histidine kinase
MSNSSHNLYHQVQRLRKSRDNLELELENNNNYTKQLLSRISLLKSHNLYHQVQRLRKSRDNMEIELENNNNYTEQLLSTISLLKTQVIISLFAISGILSYYHSY